MFSGFDGRVYDYNPHGTIRAGRGVICCRGPKNVEMRVTRMYHFAPMNESVARTISSWTYPHPYDLYNMDGSQECISELMHGDYFYVEDDIFGLIGFACCGNSARVPGGYDIGIYNDLDVLDIGMGLRPDLTGRKLGSEFLNQAAQFLGGCFGKSKFQLVVACFNLRAIKAYEKVGFTPGESFHSRVSDKQIPFVVMRCIEGYESKIV